MFSLNKITRHFSFPQKILSIVLSPVLVHVFLFCSWAFALGASLWLTAQTTWMLPNFDEWKAIVPYLTGYKTVTLAWLWSQHNEHRIFLPRLTHLITFFGSGGVFRAGAFLSDVLLAGLALLAMRTAKKIRGKASYCDAFFPLILLHWGQAENLYLSFQTAFTFPLICLYSVLLIILGSKEEISAAGKRMVLLCAMAMPLCSMVGEIMVFPVIGWFFYMTWRNWQNFGLRARSCLSYFFMALATLFMASFYFVNFRFSRFASFSSTLNVPSFTNRVAILFAMTLGWVGKNYQGVVGFFLAVLIIWSLGILVLTFWSQPSNRPQTAALLALAASVFLVVASVGMGRSFRTLDELWSTNRYATPVIPILFVCFFTPFYSSRPIRQLIQPLLAVVAGVVFSGHVFAWGAYPYDLTFIKTMREQQNELIRSVIADVPLEEITHFFFHYDKNNKDPLIQNYLWEMLRSKSLGPFSLTPQQKDELWRRQLQPISAPDQVLFSDPGTTSHLGIGWSDCGPEGRWTIGNFSLLLFRTNPGQDHQLKLRLYPYVIPGRHPYQRVRARLNGMDMGEFVFDKMDWTYLTIDLPAHLLQENNHLFLILPDAISPKAFSLNEDGRNLGLFVHSLRIE